MKRTGLIVEKNLKLINVDHYWITNEYTNKREKSNIKPTN